jgi:hypothetical protein
MTEEERGRRLLRRVQIALQSHLIRHRVSCPDGTQCREAERTIALLCHTLGLRVGDLFGVGSLLVELESRNLTGEVLP